MQSPHASLSSLPTEIKLLIATSLDLPSPYHGIPQIVQPPTTSGLPSISPLKSLSSTSREWRALLRHRLLSNLVLNISTAPPTTTTRLRQALLDTSRLLREYSSTLPDSVTSLTVVIHGNRPLTGALRNPALHSTDIITMHEFWRSVLAACDPLRLSVIAPACVLGWLTTNVPEMSDAWAFPDMGMQMLELERTSGTEAETNGKGAEEQRTAWDTQYLFCARPWSSMRLVEGSMLQAYSVYEYFHRVPPTILEGLVIPRSENITSFSDHVLFPFSTHIDALCLASLSAYRHVHFHFSPSPNLSVLDDPRIVGKAELTDCWREMEQIYRRAVSFRPLSPLFSCWAALKTFSTGDYAVTSIRELLDDEFAKHAETGWRKTGDGVWELVEAESGN